MVIEAFLLSFTMMTDQNIPLQEFFKKQKVSPLYTLRYLHLVFTLWTPLEKGGMNMQMPSPTITCLCPFFILWV